MKLLPKPLALALVAVSATAFAPRISAAEPLVDFGFDEGSGTTVGDSINSLSGSPGTPDNPPTFESNGASGQPGDTAVHFEAGQYFTVNDPDTRVRFNPDNPAFTLQAWVKVFGQPAGRRVFFYNNGPGGAASFYRSVR